MKALEQLLFLALAIGTWGFPIKGNTNAQGLKIIEALQKKDSPASPIHVKTRDEEEVDYVIPIKPRDEEEVDYVIPIKARDEEEVDYVIPI
ncbi:hypothetical protein LZ32DRAFT_609035 [Colletotrichum eremochloae]|nr:hypothetical protein LZ32DRAFT_609035 [Colletotrichum eremochloae]